MFAALRRAFAMKSRVWAALGATAILMIAGRTAAATVDVTYTGLATGFDGNVFGSNQNYVDTPFVAHYGFSDTLGTTADVTINGFTFDFISPATATVVAQNVGDANLPGYARTDSIQLYERPTSGLSSYLYIRMSNAISSDLVPQLWSDPFSATGPNTANLAPVWNTLYVEGSNEYASFSFTGQSIVVSSSGSPPLLGGSPSAAVPEPKSWIVMLGGFFGLGVALRRQRLILRTA